MEPEYIEISSKQGELKGLVKESIGNSKTVYYSFQGIPYAKPPIGKLRFKAPEPYGQWEGVRDVTKEGNDAIQSHMAFGNLVGDEDCLYLNVYTTQPENKFAKKAVMVWIHGGGFCSGSGSTETYGPDFLIEEDIVLVTINYRCGALGFLSLENEKLPGNLGLKDQTMALQWVQDNIDSFGGDPNNVTIFGESAGGASVHYHLLSPLSRGLFHKAILQSGTALCQWALEPKPREKALRLASKLGCTSKDLDEVLDFFMSVPAIDLVKNQHDESFPTDKEQIQRFALQFTPCVEVVGNTPFLPDYPRNLMEKGKFSSVPVIIGITNKEGLLALILKLFQCELINSNLSVMVPTDLAIAKDSEDEQKLGKEILMYYTGQESLSWDSVFGYIDFISDIGFAIGLENTRQYFLKNMTNPVYSYQLCYYTPRATFGFMMSQAYPDKAKQFDGYGANHGEELIHLFKPNISNFPFIPPSPEDQIFMNRLIKAWTTFAKTGNPNSKELGVIWQPDDIKNPHYMEMGKVWKSVGSISFQKRIEFWKKIYEKYSYSY